MGVWCEGEILTTPRRGKLRPEYGPKSHRGRGIIVINNSIPYYLCDGTTATRPELFNKHKGMASITTATRPITQTAQKHKENTQNASRKRVNKKSHPKITTKIILRNVKEKFVKWKFSYVHRSTRSVQFNSWKKSPSTKQYTSTDTCLLFIRLFTNNDDDDDDDVNNNNNNNNNNERRRRRMRRTRRRSKRKRRRRKRRRRRRRNVCNDRFLSYVFQLITFYHPVIHRYIICV